MLKGRGRLSRDARPARFVCRHEGPPRKIAHVIRTTYRYQRTIARPAELTGVGFLTGAAVTLRFHPAPASTGVVFVRTDLKPPVQIPARIEQVTGTARRT